MSGAIEKCVTEEVVFQVGERGTNWRFFQFCLLQLREVVCKVSAKASVESSDTTVEFLLRQCRQTTLIRHLRLSSRRRFQSLGAAVLAQCAQGVRSTQNEKKDELSSSLDLRRDIASGMYDMSVVA